LRRRGDLLVTLASRAAVTVLIATVSLSVTL